MRIYRQEVMMVIGDQEELIETEDCSKKAVVGKIDNEDISLEIMDSQGKKEYVITKEFAIKLSKALLKESTND